jgi:hypothetical protein
MAEMLSPGGALQLLEKKLTDRWIRPGGMGTFDAYYEGDHKLAFATAKFREAFGALFAEVADNWCRIVVDASAERLQVQGFRFGGSQEADTAAWDIWQANNLDGDADQIHTEAIKLAESYWLVEPPAPGSSDPATITPEHPAQMIVACAGGNRRRRIAALKRWTGEDGYGYANVYLPNQIVKYKSARKLDGGKASWDVRRDDPGGTNPLGVVPVIPVRNAPTMLRGGASDLITALPLQDAINKLLSDMLIGSEYQAFPQRVLIGAEIPKDPTTGAPLRAAELAASQSRLTVIENADGKVDQWDAASLDNYVKAQQHLVVHLSAQTRTPPHYILGQMENISGDGMKAAETGLVAKVRKKQPVFAEAHEEMMRLAFLAMGDKQRAAEMKAETIWRDCETRSQGELVDALVKLSSIGVPEEVLWERAGFSPTEITRMKAMQEAERLLAPIVPTAPTNGATPPPAPAPAV